MDQLTRERVRRIYGFIVHDPFSVDAGDEAANPWVELDDQVSMTAWLGRG